MKAGDIFKSIPNAWFDLYARFFPGALSLTVILVFNLKFSSQINELNVVWLIILSWVLGHVFATLSEWIAMHFINSEDKTTYKEAKKVEELKSMCALVSKASAEAAGFLNSFLIIAIITGITICTEETFPWELIIVLSILLLNCFERFSSWRRKINDLRETQILT